MKMNARLIWVAVILAAIVGVVLLKQRSVAPQQAAPAPVPVRVVRQPLPKLVELGSTTCIPCRAMAPILAELERDNAGRLEIQFIDVIRHPAMMDEYQASIIPTQVFVSPEGKELFRHEGFFAKEEILEQWKQLGYQLK